MSKRPSGKSIAASIARWPKEKQEALIESLSENAIASLPYIFDFWAIRDHQIEPDGDWSTWLILGGRGAGKTRTGAEWIRAQVEGPGPKDRGAARRVALLSQTLDDAREVMVMGESGIIACSPADRRPEWIESRHMLRWPNGAVATCYSAANPEKLRGPQFDCAWSDELGKWSRAKEAWDMLQFGLRLGERPRQIVTTTPRANEVLEALISSPSVKVTSASTYANAANLAPGFLREVEENYAGTSRAPEEIEGRMLTEHPGALWTRALIDRSRVRAAPELTRIIVAVDPPVTSGGDADECGIIVAGEGADGCIYVLADHSCQGLSPAAWAARAVEAWRAFEADRIVAEANQGGELVEATLRVVDPSIPYRAVRATRSKTARAEPVSALYEQGKVRHVGVMAELEDQMRGFGASGFRGSPDRVDALVWAIWELTSRGRSGTPRARAV